MLGVASESGDGMPPESELDDDTAALVAVDCRLRVAIDPAFPIEVDGVAVRAPRAASEDRVV